MEDGSLQRTEYKTTHKWAWLGHVTHFQKFGTPNNFRMKRAVCLKFGTDIENGPTLPRVRIIKRPQRGRFAVAVSLCRCYQDKKTQNNRTIYGKMSTCFYYVSELNTVLSSSLELQNCTSTLSA